MDTRHRCLSEFDGRQDTNQRGEMSSPHVGISFGELYSPHVGIFAKADVTTQPSQLFGHELHEFQRIENEDSCPFVKIRVIRDGG